MGRGAPAVFRFSHQAMSTLFEILVAGQDEKYAGQAARAAFAEIDRVERLFSRFDPGSEISRLNRLPAGESIAIGVETYECLAMAEKFREDTAGAFDINVRGLIKYGLSPDGIRLSLIRTDGGFEARLGTSPGGPGRSLDLDLGGIGKGYAIERVLDILSDWSVADALIHGGTSTAFGIGNPPGDGSPGAGWPVRVEGAGILRISGRAVSGSGTEVKGRHILDPRTGGPAAGHAAAWASHPSAAASDALSTAFMVMTTEEVAAYCGRHPETWAQVVREDGGARIFNPETAPASE
jgi:FAD:protein FMN transferase